MRFNKTFLFLPKLTRVLFSKKFVTKHLIFFSEKPSKCRLLRSWIVEEKNIWLRATQIKIFLNSVPLS